MNNTKNGTSYPNFVLEDLLLHNLGPQQQPVYIRIPMTIFHVIIFLVGFCGNVCVIIILGKEMKTSTNVYLLNLAVSDLLLIIFGLSNEILLYWRQYPSILGEFTCKARTLLSEAPNYVSIFIIVAFSTERYIAICHPFTNCGKPPLKIVVSAIWAFSFFAASPFALYSTIHYVTHPFTLKPIPDSAICGLAQQPDGIPLVEISSVLSFVIPVIILTYEYMIIGIKIYRRSRQGIRINSTDERARANRKVISMLFVVVLTFFVFWAPFHLQRLLVSYLSSSEDYEEFYYWFYHISGACYYSAPAINPIVYNFMSTNIRMGFRDLLRFLPFVKTPQRNQVITRRTSCSVETTRLSRRISDHTTTQNGKESKILLSNREK